ncbi:hypothetical protein J3Q64DRAFT_1729499 [Phycomyces blakesleeanus]|uniref:PHD-type domain-containing protein n=2 Tax=Phycomyces blakesleeanus TaxID=4837 RepID=A0A167NLU8_PHYB8|nr:hypothetical protein PHYBLDRAFT_166203 [Phycomyces blakesleeanus NRRL 1555(-)]OAD76229.1 hypothetical protein PHYBLDRAFT_166203 [Phycomyces blakesleeanus NRRL 1555(-)]|eukprot:XP_018294269.1 hypothetical protein PHYBLDRAFT_166203 [Phycomyces blakesleeanus NRRL 1555(-)]
MSLYVQDGPSNEALKRNSAALDITSMLNPELAINIDHLNKKPCLDPGLTRPKSDTAGNSKRLPLRKRLSKESQNCPVLKWQPVETPNRTPTTTTAAGAGGGGIGVGLGGTMTMNTPTTVDQRLSRPSSRPSETWETIEESPEPVIDRHTPDTTTTTTTKTVVTSTTSAAATMKKPLKKVQHWITKGKTSSPEIPQDTTALVWKYENGVDRETRTAPAEPLLKEEPKVEQTNKPVSKSLPDQTLSRSGPAADDTLYCFCRTPYDAPRFMIACDLCDQWFHGECIGISEKQSEFIGHYFCHSCAKREGKKTSWKAHCANPVCQRAARMGTKGQMSKYCSDACGMQVARTRIACAESKRRSSVTSSSSSSSSSLADRHSYLTKSRLSSFADRDDGHRLLRVRDEKKRARRMIGIVERKTAFLATLSTQPTADEDVCGYDCRLSWPESKWEAEELPSLDPEMACRQSRRCVKHNGWQKLKTLELEQERTEQFTVLAMLERERQQIKARMKRRREDVDLEEMLANGTICHQRQTTVK